MSLLDVDKLMAEARRLAAEYRRTTGQSLGISGQIAKHDACRLLDLEAPDSPPGGYDAVGRHGHRAGQRIQIKGRVIFDESKGGQRLGQLKTNADWDMLVLVLMDENFEPFEIYEATREEVEDELEAGASPARKKRGAMSVARFRKFARRVWDREAGCLDADRRENRAGG